VAPSPPPNYHLSGLGTHHSTHSVLSIDSIFEDYTIASQAENNTINLELPLLPLQRALKSALSAISASLRLTKADGVPVLCLTVTTSHTAASLTGRAANAHGIGSVPPDVLFGGMDDEYFREESLEPNLLAGGRFGGGLNGGEQRETTVVHNIPIRVLSQASVEQIHQPKVREPDAHVLLPPLLQLKSISDRFTKLALATASGASASAATIAGSGLSNAHVPKLELSANMHGNLKLSIRTDALDICSSWTGLTNPALEPDQVDGGEEGVRNHPSTVLQERGPDAWATVRIDGRDWGRVLSVGRMGGRVIACKFC
jgi:HUS1 checkpoint protein